MAYVSYFIMVKLWYTYPDLYNKTEASIDTFLFWAGGKIWDIGLFILGLFGSKALETLFYGFNVTAQIA
jgi:hypothetical protein